MIPRHRSSRLARLAALAFAIAIAGATLWPLPGQPAPHERFCIVCGSLGGIDFVSNVILFLPLGLALSVAGLGVARATAIGAAFSLGIEVLQWQVIAGRDASMGDLLSNTIGTGLGAMLATWHRVLLRPSPRMARRLGSGMTVVIVLAGATAAWALRAAPVDFNYWSQWTPERYGFEPFHGELLGLSLNDRPIPIGTIIDPSEESESFREGVFEVTALVVPDTAMAGTGLIARAGNPIGEAFELAQRGPDLLFRARRNAARISLRSPAVILRGAFARPSEGPVEIAVRTGRARIELATRDARGVIAADTLPIRLGRAWQLVAPIDVRDGALHDLGAMAVVGLSLLPLAYWAGIGVIGSASLVWLGTVALVLLGGLPVLAGIATGGPWEAGGALAGSLLGIGIGRFSAARTSGSAARRSRSGGPPH